MEEWKSIPGFAGYSVSSHGRIRNDHTGRILAKTINSHGTQIVGMMRAGIQAKRSVPVLVAKAFLARAPMRGFDTPINKDGDRENNHISNLAWRPTWFAAKFHRQFVFPTNGYKTPIYDVRTGEIFEDGLAACRRFGLLDADIVASVVNRTAVFPTYQEFRPVRTE